MLCNGFEKPGELPKERGLLYRHLMQYILRDRDKQQAGLHKSRDGRFASLSLTEKTILFSQIAFWAFSKGELVWRQEDLAKQLRIVLNSISEIESIDTLEFLAEVVAQSGVIVERARDIFSFAHLSFQEFYAAEYIASGRYSLGEIVSCYSIDDRWSQVFRMLPCLIEDSVFKTELCNHLATKQASLFRENRLLCELVDIKRCLFNTLPDDATYALASRLYIFGGAISELENYSTELDDFYDAISWGFRFSLDAAFEFNPTLDKAFNMFEGDDDTCYNLVLHHAVFWNKLDEFISIVRPYENDDMGINLDAALLSFMKNSDQIKHDPAFEEDISIAIQLLKESDLSVLDEHLKKLKQECYSISPPITQGSLQGVQKYLNLLNLCLWSLRSCYISEVDKRAIYDQLLVAPT